MNPPATAHAASAARPADLTSVPPKAPGRDPGVSAGDLDLLGAGLAGLRQADGEHAIGQVRLRLLRVRVDGKAGPAGELAAAAAQRRPAGLFADLAGDAQFSAAQLDVHVLAPHPG